MAAAAAGGESRSPVDATDVALDSVDHRIPIGFDALNDRPSTVLNPTIPAIWLAVFLIQNFGDGEGSGFISVSRCGKIIQIRVQGNASVA